MIEKIKLNDDMYNAILRHDEQLGVVHKNFVENYKFLSNETTKKIVRQVLDELSEKIGGSSMPDEHQLMDVVSSFVRQIAYEKDNDLRSFVSRSHSIINGCMSVNHELVASYMIEKLDSNVKGFTQDKEEKIDRHIIQTIIEKISNRVAVHKAYNTDYRTNHQTDFEKFIKGVVEKEVEQYYQELKEYSHDTVNKNVKEITENLINYFYPMVSKKEENEVKEESDLAKSLK